MSSVILQFLGGRSFDEASTRAMGEAYDKAWRTVQDQRQPPEDAKEIIARRIIEVATSGMRDTDELARRALVALAFRSTD
jgi:hypothetical protein